MFSGKCRVLLTVVKGAGALYREDFMYNLQILHANLGPKRQYNGPSRCDGWIGAVEKPPWEVSRALGDIWDPFFERAA